MESDTFHVELFKTPRLFVCVDKEHQLNFLRGFRQSKELRVLDTRKSTKEAPTSFLKKSGSEKVFPRLFKGREVQHGIDQFCTSSGRHDLVTIDIVFYRKEKNIYIAAAAT